MKLQTKQKPHLTPTPTPTPSERQRFIVTHIKNITESLDDKTTTLDSTQKLQVGEKENMEMGGTVTHTLTNTHKKNQGENATTSHTATVIGTENIAQ